MYLANQKSKTTKGGLSEVSFDVVRESFDPKNPANVVIGNITIHCTTTTLSVIPSHELAETLNFVDQR